LWQVFFIRCFRGKFEVLPAVLLGASVWLIYTADRVLDTFHESTLQGAWDRPRHAFYRRNRRRVAPVWAVVLTLCAWLAWTALPEVLFETGVALASAVAVYFALVHARRRALRAGSKEAAVAVIFALGTTLQAWPRVQVPSDALAILLFSALCWINCVAIEDWEHGVPARCGAVFAAVLVALAAAVLLRDHRPILGSAETASALGLMILDRTRGRLSPDAARVLADVALLSPVLFLPLAGTRP
jgi:hypothetical protein